MRYLLLFIGVGYALNGMFMLIDPRMWYDTIPGMEYFGPYNTHFIRDISIIYIVSGCGFVWGLQVRQSGVLLMASAWPALHAIYHLQVWSARGFPLDTIYLVNIAAIQAPAWLGLWAAMSFARKLSSQAGKISDGR